MPAIFHGLELLATAVILLDEDLLMKYANPAAENLFESSSKNMLGRPLREMIRNLAHEIKNPLGGIRGAAQLLERELERPSLHEYTQVIIKEADRLQTLLVRLLTPHRLPRLAEINIHEVLEQVKTLLLAEYPQGIEIERDYDSSLPPLTGDREQ